jgi:hypothetical protein
MNTFDNDPREASVWIPGSLVVLRPESNQSGLRGEQLLILRTLDEVRRKRRRRSGLVARLKLIARNA